MPGIAPMQDRICLVTGATSGLGFVTARELAAKGAHVVVLGRDLEGAAQAADRIRSATTAGSVEALAADLSSQAEVRRAARRFRERHGRLSVLVNNAGAYFPHKRTSADGIEMTFAVNHLAPFLLTNLLLDLLEKESSSRVVNVSSAAHMRAHLDPDRPEGAGRYHGFGAYARSKLANLLFTYELARRLEGTHVTANALHPGLVATHITRREGGTSAFVFQKLSRLFGRSAEEGAKTAVYLAASEEVRGVSGLYFADCRPVRSSEESYDRFAAARLWEISEAMTGLRPRA